jgi:hypothetical protein
LGINLTKTHNLNTENHRTVEKNES